MNAFYSGVLQLGEVYQDDVSTVVDLGGRMLNVAGSLRPQGCLARAASGSRDHAHMLLLLWVYDVDSVR